MPLHLPSAGDMACNPGMCPDWELNWQPFGLQAGTQSSEPYQPGLQTSIILISKTRFMTKVFFSKNNQSFLKNEYMYGTNIIDYYF